MDECNWNISVSQWACVFMCAAHRFLFFCAFLVSVSPRLLTDTCVCVCLSVRDSLPLDKESEKEPSSAEPLTISLAGTARAQSLLPRRPRMLIGGHSGLGQAHLAAALLLRVEEYPTYSIDLPTLLADPR